MAKKTYNELKTYIDTYIKTNGIKAITGAIMHDFLINLLDSILSDNNLGTGDIAETGPTLPIFYPTALFGVGSTLESIPVLNVDTGATAFVLLNNKMSTYQLIDSTEATDSPNYIRPTDYVVSVTEKVWALVGERVKTFQNSDLTTGVFTYEHLLKTITPTIIIINPDGYQEKDVSIQVVDEDNISIDFQGDIDTGIWQLNIKN